MDRYDLCLSFRRGDADIVRPFREALEVAGLRVYVDDGETTALPGIQRAATEGLARARLLAWVVGPAPGPRVGEWLLCNAWMAGLAEAAPERRVLLVLPPGLTPDAVPEPLRGLPVLALPGAEDDAARAAAVAAVRARLDEARAPVGDALLLGASRSLGLPVPWPERFVGRLAELVALHAALRAEHLATVAPAGLPESGAAGVGFGRTQLVREYALRFGAAWKGGVVWTRRVGEGPADVAEACWRDQLRDVARRLGVHAVGSLDEAGLLDAVTRALELRGDDLLWVVEAPGRGEGGVPPGLPRSPHVHVLVVLGAPFEGATVRVGPLPAPEAEGIVTRVWRPRDPSEQASAWKIAHDVGGHAFILDAVGGPAGVGAQVRAHAQLRAALRRASDPARELGWSLGPQVGFSRALPVAALLARLLEQLPPDALDVLRTFAELPDAPLTPAFVEVVFRQAGEISPDRARERAEQAFQLLDRIGVSARCGTDGNWDAERVVHPLWLAGQRQLDTDRARLGRLRAAAVRALGERLAELRDEPAPLWLLTHARLRAAAVLRRGATVGLDDASLFHGLGVALSLVGDHAGAEPCFRAASSARERLLDPGHLDTLASLEGLAQALWGQGHRDEGLRILEDLLAVRRERHGEREAATLVAMDRLARWYVELGRKAEARTYIERILEGRRRILGAYHASTLDASVRLAGVLAAEGDLPGASRMVEDALGRMGRVPERGHLDALETITQVSLQLRAAGQLHGARRFLEQATGILKRVAGADDPRTIGAVTALAKVYVDLDDLALARRTEGEALAALLRVHGERHPDTLTMMNNLGTTLSALGEVASARQHIERAWTLRKGVLGPRHTDTVVSAWNLHTLLYRSGHDSGFVLADLEWLLDARPEELSPKQRTVREALEEIVKGNAAAAPAGENPGGWQKMLLWATKPFRRK